MDRALVRWRRRKLENVESLPQEARDEGTAVMRPRTERRHVLGQNLPDPSRPVRGDSKSVFGCHWNEDDSKNTN